MYIDTFGDEDDEEYEEEEDEDDEEYEKEMTKQRQQVADQEAVDGLMPGRKVNSIGRINSINSNACHCPDASESARLAIGI